MKKHIVKHKFISAVIIIVIIIAGYYLYKAIFVKAPTPQYVLGMAKKGTLTQTVTGSGQVSAENQLDVTSEVSGKILSIKTAVGQEIKTGDLLAVLDSHDAQIDLENAKISFAKLTEPAKAGDITNAENNLAKAYSDGFGSVSNTFLDIPSVMSGLKSMLYDRDGYLSDGQNSNFTITGREYRQNAGLSFDKTNIEYGQILQEYSGLTKNSSREKIESIINKTYDFAKNVAEALKDTQSAVTFISVSQPDYNPSGATSAASNITSWLSSINSDLSSLLGAKNSIDSSEDTLKKLRDGADALDIQAEKLSLSQKQRTYEKYFVRAPFNGIVGRIPVHVYDQANSGTVIATITSKQKITDIPLNEVDAVKVAKGNKVKLTFDAISNLSVDGIVSEVDLVGTQSQGVVTYNVKISFDGTDTRILPGMSVDATIITEEKNDVLIIPSSSIKSQGKRTYVEVLSSSTVVEQVPVTLGDNDDVNTEIIDGISEGEKIIIRTIAAGTATQTGTPTIFSSFGNSQRNVIQNANRTGGTRTTNTTR